MKKHKYFTIFSLIVLVFPLLNLIFVSIQANSGFNLYFSSGSSLMFQHLYLSGFNASVTIQSGTLNGSNGILKMERSRGSLTFLSQDSCIVVPNGSMRVYVNDTLSNTITNGDNVRFVWDARYVYGRMITIGINLAILGFGLVLTIISPLYLIQKVKTKDPEKITMGFFLGLMMFIIGVALIIGWLWG